MISSRSRVRLRLVLTFCTLLAACARSGGVGGTEDAVFFPTWRMSGDEVPAAQLSGRLIEQNKCFLVERETPEGLSLYLPLWPDTFQVRGEPSPAIISDQGETFMAGQAVVLGGGSWTPRSAAEEIIGETIPERCANDAWLATSIEEG